MNGRPHVSPVAAVGIGLSALLCGCRCWPGHDLWFCTVDAIAEIPQPADHLYNPGTDLTRLGRPDGNRFPNSVICPCPDGCERCPPVADVPPPLYRIYSQPTLLAGAKESYDDRETEMPLDEVELVDPKAILEVEDAAGVQ